MNYSDPQVAKVAEKLKAELATTQDKRSVLRSNDLKGLYAQIAKMPEANRAKYGEEVNKLRAELEALVATAQDEQEKPTPIDLSAPFDINQSISNGPKFLTSDYGSKHPVMVELDRILDIYTRLGFSSIESRQIDDDYHMFESLNFPEGHPARDDYDTFVTTEGLIAPAHTSTMQNRILKASKAKLEQGKPIAYVVPGRCFRNEDVDARHEHTFYQLEGIYVDKNINTGNLVAVLQSFFTDYYGKQMDVKIQPFYFPFTEPSFEFAISCPFCKDGETCHVCSSSRWIELLGCGMIHPNVLKEAGIDPSVYTGFAWGGGVERLVMIKYGIEDIRNFEAGKLEFLRQF